MVADEVLQAMHNARNRSYYHRNKEKCLERQRIRRAINGRTDLDREIARIKYRARKGTQ